MIRPFATRTPPPTLAMSGMSATMPGVMPRNKNDSILQMDMELRRRRELQMTEQTQDSFDLFTLPVQDLTDLSCSKEATAKPYMPNLAFRPCPYRSHLFSDELSKKETPVQQPLSQQLQAPASALPPLPTYFPAPFACCDSRQEKRSNEDLIITEDENCGILSRNNGDESKAKRPRTCSPSSITCVDEWVEPTILFLDDVEYEKGDHEQ